MITKGQVIFKKKTISKNLLLFQHLHTGGVCTSFAPRHSFAGKTTLGGFFFFFFLSEINGFLPIGLAFPAEGSADVAMLCFSEHHLCTTFTMSTVPKTSLKQVQHAVAQKEGLFQSSLS